MPSLSRDQRHRIGFELNGRAVSGDAEPRMLLVDFLRHEIGATGTHTGCEHGVCGACTVQIDGTLARACLMFAVQVAGCRVDTVEGLADEDGTLSELQRAFKRHHALQCGYCTPGILMSLSHYLENTPSPSERELREVLGGHLCRCTGYAAIITAAMSVIEGNDAGSG